MSALAFFSDEEKTAGETPNNPIDAENEQEGADGFIRKEIKTVGEETCNETVSVKRPRESPPAFEKEAKKQRLESPFLQKGSSKANEMDILHALQGSLSSPSPTPSPDAWSTEKAFEIPPTIPSTVVVHSLEKAKAKDGAESSTSSVTGEKKQGGSNKGDGKSPTPKQKPSPKKRAKPARSTPSPARKSTTPVKTTPPKLPKEKSPSPLKSPLASNKSSPKLKEPGTPNASEKKTPSKKAGKPAAKATKVKKPPIKSPTANTGSEIAKENIVTKESMPKLIIKPIKQEVCKEPQFVVSELLPVNSSDGKEKPSQAKRCKSKQSFAEKPKAKKSKEGAPIQVAVKTEPKETSAVAGSKFSIADFAATTQKSPPLDKNVAGNAATDAASEHKKKKKKHKEKDKDKEKKKDKSKKVQCIHLTLYALVSNYKFSFCVSIHFLLK